MNDIALPFNLDYAKVLKVVGTIAYSIYYFYLLWLASSALISIFTYFSKKDLNKRLLANSLLSIGLRKLSFVIVLGILPAVEILSLDFIWLVGNEFSEYRTFRVMSFILFTISSIILFVYNHSSIFESQLERLNENVDEFKSKIRKLNKFFGLVGVSGIVLVLLLEAVLFTSKLNYRSANFKFDLFDTLTDYRVYLKILNYLVLGFGITFIFSLFYNYLWEESSVERMNQENDLKRKFADYSLISLLLLPVFVLIDLFSLPKQSLSYWIFLSSGFTVILIFIIANQLNAFEKENNESLGRFAFYLTILVVVFLMSKDVVATANLLKPKTVEISQNFVQYETELKNKLNIKTVTISGEEIFTAKCSACHRFDSKLVGPPYNLVLKKYENNREQLIKFILNPVKVDPQYPPMPSQGLIPPEAEAIADYIMKVYKENKSSSN